MQEYGALVPFEKAQTQMNLLGLRVTNSRFVLLGWPRQPLEFSEPQSPHLDVGNENLSLIQSLAGTTGNDGAGEPRFPPAPT